MKNKKIQALLPDSNLRGMRIQENPLKVQGENLVVDDRLEEGLIGIYENLGGSVYISMEPHAMDNLVLVASAEVEDLGGKRLWLKRSFHEYGYEEIWYSLVNQLIHFAQFYGYVLGILDLRKEVMKDKNAQIS